MRNWVVRSKNNQNGSSLTHYGVKGMKWGIRRTPEQLGHRRKSAEGSQQFKYRAYMPDKRTAVSRIAATIGTTSALISYAVPAPQVLAVTIPTMIASAVVTTSVNNSVTDLLLDKNEYPDSEKRSLKSLPKKTREMTREEDCAAVNVPLSKGGVNNCSNCILAYDMRRRGYDVSAAKTNTPSYTQELVDKCYKGKKDVMTFRMPDEEIAKLSTSGQKKLAETAYNKMVKEAEDHFPVGSRGFINVGYANSNVGHVFNWERDETGMNFYDAQSGKNQKTVMYTLQRS